MRPRGNIDRQTEPMDQNMDQEVDSPFSMNQIKTSIMNEGPARERANLVLARLEPEMQVVQPDLTRTKSDPIMIAPDIKASCAFAEPKAWGIEARKKDKCIHRAMEIMSKDDYSFAIFGKIPGSSPRILWREDGSMFTPKGMPYLPAAN